MYTKDAILYVRGDWPRVLYNIYNMYNVYSVYNIYKYVIKKGGFLPSLFFLLLFAGAEQVSVSIIYNIYNII